MDVGSLVKELRLNRKWSQSDLANKLHVTQPAIGHWESGRRTIPQDKIIDIAKIFDVSVDYLYGTNQQLTTTPRQGESIYIPLINVAAGSFQGDYSQLNEEVELPSKYAHLADKSFAIRISGDSMDKVLPNGYVLIVEDIAKTSYKPKNGDFVVCEKDGEYTVKSLIETNDLIILEPKSHNTVHKSIVFDKTEEIDLKMLGVVKYSFRGFE